LDNIATKNSAENFPIIDAKLVNISEIAPDFKLSFSEEQYIKLQKGLIPEAMEDKWFIYFENDWLYFHRSWTGRGIFRVEIIKEENGCESEKYTIKEFYVERDEVKNGDDKFDFDVLLQLILWGLLEIDVRNSFSEKYVDGTSGLMLTWALFGRLFISD